MKKSPSKYKHLEHLLLPRLQFLGWLLILFGCITFTYMFTISPKEEASLEDTLESEEDIESSGPSFGPIPQLKLEIVYLGISTFWIIGTACIIFSRRKKKQLSINK